jgi:hypothetical protein
MVKDAILDLARLKEAAVEVRKTFATFPAWKQLMLQFLSNPTSSFNSLDNATSLQNLEEFEISYIDFLNNHKRFFVDLSKSKLTFKLPIDWVNGHRPIFKVIMRNHDDAQSIWNSILERTEVHGNNL